MKLGPFNLRSPLTSSKPSQVEIGASGSAFFNGRLGEDEYNSDLAYPESYNVYDRMRSDGQVAAALRVIKLPLLNAEWKVERASDSALDRMVAEVLEEDFLPIWRGGVCRQSLLHLDYGSMPFEEVWKVGTDGLIRLAKLAPRLPKTIVYWNVDDVGELTSVEQWAAPKYQPVVIPANKLLLFVNELEGSNYRGRSLLRSAYKHWYYKDNLYRVEAIALEKRSLGTDVMRLSGEGINAETKRQSEAALATLHAHEKGYLVDVEGQAEYRLEGGNATGLLSPQAAIEHHDLRILRSMIVEFVGMGAGSTGSLAMHRDKTSFVLLALGGIADGICETVQSQLFSRWVGYNWAGAEVPRLRCTRLEQRDVRDWADSVSKLVQAGVLTNDETIEEETRDLLSLPEAEEPKVAPAPAPAPEGMPVEEAVETVRALRGWLKTQKGKEE